MKKDNLNEILELIKKYSLDNKNQRFTQILFNLGINQFENNPSSRNLRDNYNDLDSAVLERINTRLEYLKSEKYST